MSDESTQERLAIVAAKRWYRQQHRRQDVMPAAAVAQGTDAWRVMLYTATAQGIVSVDVDLATGAVAFAAADVHYIAVAPTLRDEADALLLALEEQPPERGLLLIEEYLHGLRRSLQQQVLAVVDEELPDGDVLKIAISLHRLFGERNWPNLDFP